MPSKIPSLNLTILLIAVVDVTLAVRYYTPLYIGHAPLYRPRPFISVTPLYIGHAPLYRPRPFISATPLYIGHAPLYRPRPFISATPLYIGHAPLYRPRPFISVTPHPLTVDFAMANLPSASFETIPGRISISYIKQQIIKIHKRSIAIKDIWLYINSKYNMRFLTGDKFIYLHIHRCINIYQEQKRLLLNFVIIYLQPNDGVY